MRFDRVFQSVETFKNKVLIEGYLTFVCAPIDFKTEINKRCFLGLP